MSEIERMGIISVKLAERFPGKMTSASIIFKKGKPSFGASEDILKKGMAYKFFDTVNEVEEWLEGFGERNEILYRRFEI